MTNLPLPIRVAHPSKPQLEHLDDDYFKFLVRCGYEGLYLQESPFDTLSGNHGAFKKSWHLIYLYDLSRGPERQRYVDYVNEVCRRAAQHGLKTYLCCWEPRLPLSAWGDTPPSWRGNGGFYYGGRMNLTSFCWSEPEAVTYWKQMAVDAFAAIPEIAGVHLGVADNEASFCDETCPKCQGQTQRRQLEDIFDTFGEIKRKRPGFRIAIYDWWLPDELLDTLPGIIGTDALIIGRSAQGHRQPPLTGEVRDMTMIFDGCGPGIVEKKKKADRLGLRLVDMTAWSHANESFFLPAPPDPRYAVEKLNALRALGAEGWYDFDCGSTEPGSVAEAMIAWTRRPDAPPETLVTEVLSDIFGDHVAAAKPAYEIFREAKREYPIAFDDPSVSGFSSRSLSLGFMLLGPFRLCDFRFMDLRHCIVWFAPSNFVTASTLPVLLPRFETVVGLVGRAFETIKAVPVFSPEANREKDSFEIHYRCYRAIRNFFRLGKAKLDWLERRTDRKTLARCAGEVAEDELENLDGIERWLERNPGMINNPCHSASRWIEEAWPDISFPEDLLAVKRQSLSTLRDNPDLPMEWK